MAAVHLVAPERSALKVTLSVLCPFPKESELTSITASRANLANEVMMPLQLDFAAESSMQLQFEFRATLQDGIGSARLSNLSLEKYN
jgi:hypothetical protein